MIIYCDPNKQFASTCSKLAANHPGLKDPDFSYFFFDDASAEVLGASLRNNTQPLELSLSAGEDLTARGAEALVTGLQGSHMIKFQIWDKGVSSDAKEIILNGLQPLQYLKKLHLNWGLTETEATWLWRSLKDKTLEFFSFRINPNITRHGVDKLVAICCHSNRFEVRLKPDVPHEKETTLFAQETPISWSFHILGEDNQQRLAIEGSPTGNLFILADFLTSLVQIELNRCFDVVPTMQLLLPLSKYLETLRLHNCEIDDTKMRTLCQGLYNIRELSFLGNQISDDGVDAFVHTWLDNSPIEHLSLSSNNITVVGARRLLMAASRHPTLDTLDISQNKRIGYSGLQRLAHDSVPQVNLKELDLSGCGRERNEYLAYDQVLTRQRASDEMLEAVRVNDHLVSLTFDKGEIVHSVQYKIDVLLFLRNQG